MPNVMCSVVFRPLIQLLCFILYFVCISTAFGEGTKQWSPSAADNNYLKVNAAGVYAFAGYGLPEPKRLHIHIDDPSTEVVHLGFSWMVNEPANTDITTAYEFRIVSPSGGIVHGPFSMSSPNITSHAQAVAGPSTINAGGYTTGGMWTFTPTTSGDHYIEFATAGSIRWFDITVADSGGAIDGRLWSRAWTARADNGYNSLANAFDTPFNGALVAYDGQFATKIDFNGSGIRPLEGQFSFNPTGTANTGNKEEDRKSVAGSNAGNPSHKIFLNTPDTSVYPLGVQGQLQNLPLKVNSSSSPNIPIDVTQPGQIELFMNLGGGTKDRRFFADVVAGVNQVPWDGLDGDGLQMQPRNFPIPVTITYTQGETHFTAYDVEGLDNGFQVYTNTSVSTIGPNLQFWDDSNITFAPGTPDVQVNVDTGAASRRRWVNTSYGDLNTLNTWWYAYRDSQSTTILLPGDYGDAPSAYASPMHEVADTPLVYLGAVSPDRENSPTAPFDGTGDDVTGTPDEDAVVGSLPILIITDTNYDLNVPCVGEGATVAGWIDFDNNQIFDSAERTATTCLSGNANLSWAGLSGLSASETYLRLRIASSAADVSSPSSAAADGEVEDYPLTITTNRCESTVDIWYANDESGSVNATEFTQARDFIYQVTDGFYHSAIDGAQSGLVGWAFDAVPVNVVIPITDTFDDRDDFGLATTGTTVDGDGLGVRETYTAKVSATTGTQLANATQGLADLINAGNGRRTGVPQVAVILTDAPNSQINNVSGNGGGTAWEAAAANLRAAGPDGTRIVVILLAEAADAYDNDVASQATIDSVIGSTGFIVKTSSYANAADATNGYVNQAIDGICGAATIPVTDDYSDAPADGSVAPNGSDVTAYGVATHAIDSGLQLGAAIDSDSGSIASANADGDGADDDGVSLLETLTDLSRTFSVESIITNQTGNTARLIAWIDFDGNGVFDPDEAAIRSVPSGTTNGTVTLNWSNIPIDIQVSDSFLRLRLTTDSLTNLEPNGSKTDGEVEDYAIAIVSAGVTVSGRVYVDANNNANEEAGELGISNTVVVLHDLFTGTCRSVSTTGSGDYHFAGVPTGGYEIYQAHGEGTPTPQNCGTAFSNNPTGYQSTTPDVLFATVGSIDLVDQDFGEVGGTNSPTSGNTGTGITFEPDHQSEILPGNVVFYAHTLSSEADGNVIFTTTETGNTAIGWTHTLYEDSNCDGTLNGTESDTILSGGLTVTSGNPVCLINKVFAPANVPAQDRYEVITTATFTYPNGTLPTATLSVNDLTTAGQTLPQGGESRLELIKTVENLTQGTPETDTSNQASPLDVLRYRIYYRNTGTGPITDLKVNDVVPAYTGLVSGSAICNPPLSGMTCLPVVNFDEIHWEFTGPLIGGSENHVSYEVRVDN